MIMSVGSSLRALTAADPGAETTGELKLSETNDPKRITPSFQRAFGRPKFAGCLERAGEREISGWVCKPNDLTETLVVALSLGGEPLAFASASIRRPDVDEVAKGRAFPGFVFDLTSADAHRMASDSLATLLARHGPDHTLRLAASVVEGGAQGDAALRSEHYFAFPADFADARTLRGWFDFFDVDEDALRARLIRDKETEGVTPRHDAAEGSPLFIAFYLPQFHTVDENDEWWGAGFTEWTGVTTAKPLFPDHAMPHVPADLGFYDLRVRETRRKQGQLARQYGVYGFCYYFYWFSGRRILEKPLELMLADGEPNMPFCLCWANEPWSRRWDGSEHEVLLEQKHDLETDLRILDDLMPYFEDPRYIRVDGKPVLVIYRSQLMPERAAFVARLQAEARKRGLPGLHMCNVMSFGETDASAHGFDAAVEFPPHNVLADEAVFSKAAAPVNYAGKIYSFADMVAKKMSAPPYPFAHYPGVMPRWDNTARKGSSGNVFHGSTPSLFEVWLRHAAKTTLQGNPNAPLCFINSWNEWGEGAHLEPDRRTGRRYLDAVRRVASGEMDRALASPTLDAPPLDDPQAALIAALATENRLLAERVSGAVRMLGPTPFMDGFPDALVKMSSIEAGGVGYIDECNFRRAESMSVVRRDAPMSLMGWFCGDRAVGGHPSNFAFLVLTRATDRQSYFAPIMSRTPRADAAQALSLPDTAANLGFSGAFDISGLAPGLYSIRIFDVLEKRAVQINLKTVLRVR
ncbi:MAG: glycoside hydrolase family 99-like domain-containing protein [Hyphomicrobiales bacterium]|nr:glycoside hydrolase family 99-like domain-containing protein [Hyphomicrobiales bacterium]